MNCRKQFQTISYGNVNPVVQYFYSYIHATQCIIGKGVELNQPVAIQSSSKILMHMAGYNVPFTYHYWIVTTYFFASHI